MNHSKQVAFPTPKSIIFTLSFGIGAIVLLLHSLRIVSRDAFNFLQYILLWVVLLIVLILICKNFLDLWRQMAEIQREIEAIYKRIDEGQERRE
jgi:tellurite resistance protein TehA-like permease